MNVFIHFYYVVGFSLLQTRVSDSLLCCFPNEHMHSLLEFIVTCFQDPHREAEMGKHMSRSEYHVVHAAREQEMAQRRASGKREDDVE